MHPGIAPRSVAETRFWFAAGHQRAHRLGPRRTAHAVLQHTTNSRQGIACCRPWTARTGWASGAR